MAIKYLEEYRDPQLAGKIVARIKTLSRKQIRLMEVCGTHTMAIFKSGIRSLLPETISLLSGPGCPVCVTDQNEIDACIKLSRIDNVIVATFGDLLRVPGSDSSLQKEQAKGRDIRMVYSTFDALDIARKNPGKQIVFLGIGFETTAPTVAASILSAKEMRIDNYSVFSVHKRVPPALTALMETEQVTIDGFLLPGHVSVIIGTRAYNPFFEKYHAPCVIAGFEPADILQAILTLVEQLETDTPKLTNSYRRAVATDGNVKAQEIMGDIFETVDVNWRGIGTIAKSGFKIRKKFASYDAETLFDMEVAETTVQKGCACGEILMGLKIPSECALYKKRCTPMDPVGPCMVSSEGTCAAYYRYHNT
jgi:hydrogenase expression/formation protein HypD